jgi:hypothetical protein
MQLIAPDILAEARGLSVGVTAAGLAVGLLLWLLGWWGHRFWVVLAATVGAGVFGLYSGPDFGMQRLVAGLLLAVAAGVLALALVRLVAFAAGGVVTWLVVRAVAPGWNDLQGQLICLLAGGLVSLLLFRVWVMALTSLAGTLLMGYAGLSLAETLGRFDSASWAEQNALILNIGCGTATLLGLVVQFLLDRRRRYRERYEEMLWEDDPRFRRSRRWAAWPWGDVEARRRAG